MPTASNKVKFQYIGTTAPSTYDSDTIYFDSVNKGILVGSTPVATFNTSINVYNYHPSGIVNEIKANKDQTHYYFYDGYRKLELVWCNTIAVFSSVVPGVTSVDLAIDRDQGYFPGIVTVYVDNNGTITYQNDIELSKKKHLSIKITDIDNITGQFDTNYRTFSSITLKTGTSWSDWVAALQNPDNYNLEIKWTPSDWASHSSIDSYGHTPKFTLTNFTINNYFDAILFSIPITGGVLSSNDGNKRNDILEICVMPNSQEVKGCLRSTFKVCFSAPSPTSWPSSYTALTAYQNSDTNYTFTWGDILEHQYDLELQLFNSSNGGFISRATNYVMGTDEVLFGPFMNNSSTLYMVDVMKNGSNSNTPTCVIKKV